MMTPDAQRELLKTSKIIAVVGHSDKPERTSYQIAQFLRRAGYTVYPVNPSIQEIDGQAVYASLADVPGKIDIVNVFRQSEFLPGVVDEAIAVGAGAVWAQLGVADSQAAAQAEAAGLPLVMDTCIKVAYLDLL
jgi:uncharacterized protein